MKKNWLLGSLCFVGVAVLLGYAWFQLASAQDHQALTGELDLARKDGMPTTWAEYAALVKPVLASENAAPYYRLLSKLPTSKTDVSQLESDLLFRPKPEALVEAEAELTNQRSALVLIDQAASKPSCWFDRDWSKGLALLMPELAKMKFGARLLCLRGSLATLEGHPEEAVQNIREILQIARHAGQDSSDIAQVVEGAIFTTAIRQLALYAYLHRDQPIYRVTLARLVADWPKPNLQQMHRGDLLEIRDVLRLSTTPAGRADLGLKEENVPVAEKLVPLIVSRPKADIQIARSMREIYEAYAERPAVRLAKINAAEKQLEPALVAYPTGGDIYLKLTSGSDSSPEIQDHSAALYDQVWEARRVSYLVLLKALAGPATPKSLNSSDLVSPFDGKPATYSKHGNQITIQVSCPDKGITLNPLKIPSEKELSPATKSRS